MYRTKVFNYLMDNIINPILKFEGLCLKNEDGLRYLKYIDFDEKNQYIMDQVDPTKKLVFITSENEFIKYKSMKDTVTFFNPLCKYKNMLYLIMLSMPIIYMTYCTSDDDDNLASSIVDDTITPSSEEIIKCINFKENSSVKDKETNETIYSYSLSLCKDNGDKLTFKAANTSKIIALSILMLKVLKELDVEVPEIITENQNDYAKIELVLKDQFDKYAKERQLNTKDMSKFKREDKNDVEFNSNTEDEIISDDNVNDLLNESDADERNKIHDKTVDLMKEFENVTFIKDDKETDQDFHGLEFI